MTDKEELQKAYLLMQANCGIETGDTVKVLRKPKSFENGWNKIVANTDIASANVGRSFTVSHIGGDSIVLDVEGTAWCYPFFVLEKQPKPHWRDTVSPENPVLCYVKDSIYAEWSAMPYAITNYADCIFRYRTASGGWKYAKRVPREIVEKMLVGYAGTSEEE